MSVVHEANTQDDKFLLAIRELRLRNFSKDLPFLILSDKLPANQVYKEYADGHIEIQKVFTVGNSYQHKIIRVLTELMADKIRRKYDLI